MYINFSSETGLFVFLASDNTFVNIMLLGSSPDLSGGQLTGWDTVLLPKRTKSSVGPYSTRLAVIELGSLIFPEILTGIERKHTMMVGSAY